MNESSPLLASTNSDGGGLSEIMGGGIPKFLQHPNLKKLFFHSF